MKENSLEQESLEQEIKKISLWNRVTSTVKNNLGAYMLATALTLGTVAVSSCGDDNPVPECCAQLSCYSSGDETCNCVESSPHDADKCVYTKEGRQCCECNCYTVRDRP